MKHSQFAYYQLLFCLAEKFVPHSGSREELKLHAKDVVQKKGLNNINHEDLVKEITPKGRSLVPDVVKKELLVKIQTFLSQQHNM